jgi:hypothetical protein
VARRDTGCPAAAARCRCGVAVLLPRIRTLIYVVYVSVVGLAVERIVSAPLPAELGGANPFTHVLMMGGVPIAALMLLRHIRIDMSGRRRGSA